MGFTTYFVPDLTPDTEAGIVREGRFVAGEALAGVPQTNQSEVGEGLQVVEGGHLSEGAGGF